MHSSSKLSRRSRSASTRRQRFFPQDLVAIAVVASRLPVARGQWCARVLIARVHRRIAIGLRTRCPLVTRHLSRCEIGIRAIAAGHTATAAITGMATVHTGRDISSRWRLAIRCGCVIWLRRRRRTTRSRRGSAQTRLRQDAGERIARSTASTPSKQKVSHATATSGGSHQRYRRHNRANASIHFRFLDMHSERIR